MKGEITFYNAEKGFGFIKSDDKEGIFFHISDVKNGTSIEKGVSVEFSISEGQKGKVAKNVKIISAGNRPFQKNGNTVKSKEKRNKDDKKNKQNVRNSWNIKNSKLPHDTKEALNNIKIDNFNLKLNKASQTYDNKKFEFYKTNGGKVELNVQPDYTKIQIEQLKDRHNSIIESYRKSGYYIECISEMKPDWRLVIGLGSGSVYETSMTLHHIYGIPYIPGSAVKGVVRSFIITEEFGMDNGELDLAGAEARALHINKTFCDIFGCPKEFSYNDKNRNKKKVKSAYEEARRGRVIFMDAFPLNTPEIKPDIMNPHYGDYYSGDKPPADYLSPVPIPFLTVENTSFDFYLLAENRYKSALEAKIGENTILIWLKKALTEHGIGAKTAVGYGYMSEVK